MLIISATTDKEQDERTRASYGGQGEGGEKGGKWRIAILLKLGVWCWRPWKNHESPPAWERGRTARDRLGWDPHHRSGPTYSAATAVYRRHSIASRLDETERKKENERERERGETAPYHTHAQRRSWVVNISTEHLRAALFLAGNICALRDQLLHAETRKPDIWVQCILLNSVSRRRVSCLCAKLHLKDGRTDRRRE